MRNYPADAARTAAREEKQYEFHALFGANV
jgi:hypothetical protein